MPSDRWTRRRKVDARHRSLRKGTPNQDRGQLLLEDRLAAALAELERERDRRYSAELDAVALKECRAELQGTRKELKQVKKELAAASKGRLWDSSRRTNLATIKAAVKEVSMNQLLLQKQEAARKLVDETTIASLRSQLAIAEATLKRIRPLRRGAVSGKQGRSYPDWFFMMALAIVATGTSAAKIRCLLRIFQRTFLPHLVAADFEIPSEDWWRKLREKLLVAEKILNSLDIAAVKSYAQIGWDESEVNRRNTLSVWVRIAADAESKKDMQTIFLATAKAQVGGKAEEVNAGIQAVFVSVCAPLLSSRTTPTMLASLTCPPHLPLLLQP
jgi:hypothetical protein